MPETSEQELLPCPFCGSATAPRLDYDHLWTENAWYVVCGVDGCGARSRVFGSYESGYKEKAAKVWNTRAPTVEATLKDEAELDALRANQAAAVQDVWDKAIKIAKANGANETHLSILSLYALEAARQDGAKGKGKLCVQCGNPFRYPPTDNKADATKCAWCSPVEA